MNFPELSDAQSGRAKPILCYVTDRHQFSGSGEEQVGQLLAKIAECAAAGVDFIQLREKDLSARQLEALALQAMAAIPAACSSKLLINSRIDIALASGAAGVTLPAGDVNAGEARSIWGRSNARSCVIAVSAHSVAEVALAEAHGADFAFMGPVFEKSGRVASQGLVLLEQAARRPSGSSPQMPVLALGGVTLESSLPCLAAGAAGIAGIRMFQQNSAAALIPALRHSVPE